MAVDTRGIPLASVWLYRDGCDDAPVTDWGTCRYDLLEKNCGAASYSTDANGVNKLRIIPGAGLTCREYYVPKDTLLANYTTTGGQWEQRRPATGSPRPYFLVQYSAMPDVQWQAQSTFNLPSDPSFACVFDLADTPPDHDSTTYPPYAQLQFGDEWRMSINRESGARLWRNVAGTYVIWGDLPTSSGIASGRGITTTYFVRVQRGKLWVSEDWGVTWQGYGNQDGSALSVSSSQIYWRGQGMRARVGLHQLCYFAGAYTSQEMQTGKVRSGETPSLGYRGTSIYGSVALADMAVTGTSLAQYRVTLTPDAPSVGAPFPVHRAPDVQAVQMVYPVTWGYDLGLYDKWFDDELLSVDVDKPEELDGDTATLVVRRDPAVNFDTVATFFRYRKCRVWLGYADTAGATPTAFNAFTGYIRTVDVSQPEYNKAEARFALDNVTIRLKRAKWNALQGIVPLGNQSPNAALSFCMAYAGFDAATHAEWNSLGDGLTLPAGTAEEAFLLPREGEPVWDTMVEISRFSGMEVGATDTGLVVTLPVGWTQPAWAARTFDVDPTALADLNDTVLAANNRLDYSDSYTMVLMTGKDEAGGEIYGYVIDRAAEETTGNPRYSGIGRNVWQESVPGVSTQGFLANLALSWARDKLLMKSLPDIVLPVQLGINRRDRLLIRGVNIGMNTGAAPGAGAPPPLPYRIATLSHHYEPEPAGLTTKAGLRRIYP